jgi:hypothetical protein
MGRRQLAADDVEALLLLAAAPLAAGLASLVLAPSLFAPELSGAALEFALPPLSSALEVALALSSAPALLALELA